jgi:DNA polymerase-3 subunit delta
METSRVHVFLGTDEARVREDALRTARALTPPDNQEFGLEIVNGSAETAEHAAAIVRQTIEGLNTLPFFGGDKTVWLQGANFLAETVTGKSASAQAAVERLGVLLEAGLPNGVSFVLSATEIDKRRSFYKILSKFARMTVHDLPEPGKQGFEADCMRLVQQRAGRLGLELEAPALELFVALTGESSRTLDMELEKLAAYVGPGARARQDDVRAIVSQTRSGIIFEIGDALAQRQLSRTLELVDQQLGKGESAISILLAAIVPRVRNLLVARELTERHGIRVGAYAAFQSALARLPAEATAHLPRNKDGSLGVYPLFLAAKTCHRFTARELAEGLKACLEANLKLVTTQTDPRIVLSQLVVGLLQRPAVTV